MKKARYLMLLLTLSLIVVVSACTSENPNELNLNDHNEIEQNYQPTEGGTLNLSVTRFNTLNPLYNQNYSVYQLQHMVYESLVTFNEDMTIEPQIAESWIVSEDGQSIEFTLREGITWHDGEPFTADDVIYTISLIKNNTQVRNPSIFKTSLRQVSDIRETSENTIEVTFTRPFSNGLEVMTFPILPKHIHENNIEDDIMIGTGPFKLTNYETMRSLTLERNLEYWGKTPYIDKIKVEVVPDAEAQLSLFENGDIDLAQPISVDWDKYSRDKSVKIYEYVSNHFEFLGFNFRNPLLQDPLMRKAIARSIDRNKIANDIYLGHGAVTDTPIMPGSWLEDTNVLSNSFDLSAAENLLEQGGYLLDDANVRKGMNGENINLNLITSKGNILREQKAMYVQNNLEKLGINVHVKLLDWDDFEQEVTAGKFDLVIAGWELSYVPDLSFAFHSTNVPNTNFINYQNEEMDQLLEKAFSASSRSLKNEVYSQIQQHIVDEVPYHTLLFKNASVIMRNNIQGEIKPNAYNIFKGIEEWYIIQ
ncbi:peptide ABC transporter substrate-binding protein [Serpentinicella sp. ANB-PHB4]|uniref:ABC transporter substrate-binding protein n=1 Tax=Serpentinicella sp. ANB-PHB4 TaxID=3074076 RepID=UPI002865D2C7|nr:peptide ABC transporter substrate-binding protein [Serpentinicella sp. ANB-PHB4]MDR5657951.1 peptide ABC transporter substrate-binding protein [Serpentinicella sp. ANB-PHB4]